MNRLVELLKEAGQTVDNCEFELKTCELKCQLQEDFPQLIFFQPKQKNHSELVLYEGAVADFVQHAVEVSSPLDTLSEDNASADEMDSHCTLPG